jgi:hypothetical protein
MPRRSRHTPAPFVPEQTGLFAFEATLFPGPHAREIYALLADDREVYESTIQGCIAVNGTATSAGIRDISKYLAEHPDAIFTVEIGAAKRRSS